MAKSSSIGNLIPSELLDTGVQQASSASFPFAPSGNTPASKAAKNERTAFLFRSATPEVYPGRSLMRAAAIAVPKTSREPCSLFR